MRIIDARVSGPFLDLLMELSGDRIVAARTAIDRLDIEYQWPRQKIDGSIGLRLFQIEAVPEEWRERMHRASLAAPDKRLPKP